MTHFDMNTELLPKPVLAVLDRGARIYDARPLPEPEGWSFIDPEPCGISGPEELNELIIELFKHKVVLFQLFKELKDAITADGSPYDDFRVGAAMINGSLVIAACLHMVSDRCQISTL